MNRHIAIVIGIIIVFVALSGLYYISGHNLGSSIESRYNLCCEQSLNTSFQGLPFVVGISNGMILFYNFSIGGLFSVQLNSGVVSPLSGISIPSNVSDYLYYKIFGVNDNLVLLKCSQSGVFTLENLNSSSILRIDGDCSKAAIAAYPTGNNVNINLIKKDSVELYTINVGSLGKISIIYNKSFKFNNITPIALYPFKNKIYMIYLKTNNTKVGSFSIYIRVYSNGEYNDFLVAKSLKPSGMGFLLAEDGTPYLYIINSTNFINKLVVYNVVDNVKMVCNKTINSTIAFPIFNTYSDFDNDGRVELVLFTAENPWDTRINLELLKIGHCNKSS